MKGLGTDEETLVEILCSRSQEEVLRIAAAYQAGTCSFELMPIENDFSGIWLLLEYGNTLVDDIKGDTSGPLQRLLVMTVEVT